MLIKCYNYGPVKWVELAELLDEVGCTYIDKDDHYELPENHGEPDGN